MLWPATMAPIRSLAWQPPYAPGTALERQKPKKKKKKKKDNSNKPIIKNLGQPCNKANINLHNVFKWKKNPYIL